MTVDELQKELDSLESGSKLYISNMHIHRIHKYKYAVYLRISHAEEAYNKLASVTSTDSHDYFGNYLGTALDAEGIVKLLYISKVRASQALDHLL